MGYIDSSTANIVSILTRKGREVLARNDGTFRITKFKIGDDEINYQLYNPTNVDNEDADIIGLPILEPSTDADSALRFPLVTMPEGTRRVAELAVTPNSIMFDLAAQSGVATIEAKTLYNEDQFYLVSFTNLNSTFVSGATVQTTGLYTVNSTQTDAGVRKMDDYIVSANHNLQMSVAQWKIVFTFQKQASGVASTQAALNITNGPYFLGTMFISGQQSGVFTTIDIYGNLNTVSNAGVSVGSINATVGTVQGTSVGGIPVGAPVNNGQQNQGGGIV